MFAAAANGTLLPPYVCYKSKELYSTWREYGPIGCRFNRTPSGWFTAEVFCDWFFTIAIPYFRRLNGKKVLIGDNLASHISYDVIQKAIEEGISFVFLLPNSTHLCQPLDFSVFKPLKSSWSKVLKNDKKKHKGALQKSMFPRLLKETLDNITNMKENVQSGFKYTGMVPFNPDIVLTKIPDKDDVLEIGEAFLKPVVDLLHSTRSASIYLSKCV